MNWIYLKHWNKMSNKKFKNIKKQKTISIISASRKLGVTHMCLCLANFLSSALKQKVLYIELSDESQLLGMVGENQITILNKTGFFYKGVNYILACSVEDALSLINDFNGYIVVDIFKYSEETKVIFNRCERRIIIGSMKPWCKKDVYQLMSKLKGGTGLKNMYYNVCNSQNEKNDFKKMYGCSMESLPYIKNPFSLKEEDFDPLFQMIQ